jgi:hypothetical protein
MQAIMKGIKNEGIFIQPMRKQSRKTILARRKKTFIRQSKAAVKVVRSLPAIANLNIMHLRNSKFQELLRFHNAKRNIYSRVLHKATVLQPHHLEKGHMLTFNSLIIVARPSKLAQISMTIQKNSVVRKH